MKEQSTIRERAKFSRRILRSRRRILQSPMPNEHPEQKKLLVRHRNLLAQDQRGVFWSPEYILSHYNYRQLFVIKVSNQKKNYKFEMAVNI